jgi:hypothetical protein
MLLVVGRRHGESIPRPFALNNFDWGQNFLIVNSCIWYSVSGSFSHRASEVFVKEKSKSYPLTLGMCSAAQQA